MTPTGENARPLTFHAIFGTLYTAIYRSAELTVAYHWPGSSWRHSIAEVAVGQRRPALRGDPSVAQVPR